MRTFPFERQTDTKTLPSIEVRMRVVMAVNLNLLCSQGQQINMQMCFILSYDSRMTNN